MPLQIRKEICLHIVHSKPNQEGLGNQMYQDMILVLVGAAVKVTLDMNNMKKMRRKLAAKKYKSLIYHKFRKELLFSGEHLVVKSKFKKLFRSHLYKIVHLPS